MYWTRRPMERNEAIKRFTTNFYFSDFPEGWKISDMWTCFGAFGLVADVYIPTKRAKNDNRFRFVRFKRVRDEVGLENRLKDIQLGDHNIFIKLARFRRPNGKDIIKALELHRQMKTHFALNRGKDVSLRLHGGRSYLDILTDN